MSKLFMCACVTYAVHIHIWINLNFKWQLFPDLRGKTCFEILHSEKNDGLWSKSESAGKYGVYTSHPTYILLQSKYGVDRKEE